MGSFLDGSKPNEAETNFLNSKRTDIDISFENLVKVYTDTQSVRIEQTTLATKGHMISTKILPYFAKMPLSEIDTATVMYWQTELKFLKNTRQMMCYYKNIMINLFRIYAA